MLAGLAAGELPADGYAGVGQLLRPEAAGDELVAQAQRDEVEVEVALGEARAAGVVRGDLGGGHVQKPAAAQLAEHEGRENMDAEDGVIAALEDAAAKRPRAPGAGDAEGPGPAAPLHAVAHAEEAGHVAVYKGVAPAYDLSLDAGQETQRVHYDALGPGFGRRLCHGAGGGGVSSAGTAGEYEQLHVASRKRAYRPVCFYFIPEISTKAQAQSSSG